MKKILTIILDGFGMREDIYGNAVKMAGMNNFINIWNNYPHCLLKASGISIDLPENQCSSSELGHKIIGCGRDIESRLVQINNHFRKNSLKTNPKYAEMVKILKSDSSKNLHIVIMLSDGGVSSHIKHLKQFLEKLSEHRIDNNIYIHAISDGRDCNKFSLQKYLHDISGYCSVKTRISTVCGRYYALDETKDYKRTKMYYDLLVEGRGVDAINLPRVIEKCYEKKISDEYLPPLKTQYSSIINRGDVLFFANFSKDNQYQILNAFANNNFGEFNARKLDINIYSFFEIDNNLNENYFFETEKHKNTLPEYLSNLGLTQAHVFESVKESSMTYFLNGERKTELKGCDKYIIPSPRVDSFDMKPEMDSLSLAKTAIKCMEKDYDFIMVNFANPDEVGHTGNYQATINSLQAVDVCLGKMLEVAEENFYKVVIISSHGNADTIIDRENNIITKNTLSPVPFVILDKKIKLNNGRLTDFAPTLLKYMDITPPKEMKNSEILVSKK